MLATIHKTQSHSSFSKSISTKAELQQLQESSKDFRRWSKSVLRRLKQDTEQPSTYHTMQKTHFDVRQKFHTSEY